MGEISQDASTGFVAEEELVQLAEAPEDLAAGAGDVVHSISAISVIISASAAWSAALPDACPTSACTTRC